MSTNPFDQACRYLARLDPIGLLCWLLGLPASAFSFEGWLNTRTVPFPGEPERTCDTVAHLRDLLRGGVPWAIPIEFQLAPDHLMFGRLLIYLGRLWIDAKPSPERGDRFEVAALVVNLTGRGNSGRDMAWTEAGLRTALSKPDRDLAGYAAAAVLADIAAGRVTKVVLPFIPLMQGGGEDAIIRQWVDFASAETDAGKRGDYGGLALVFAEAAGCAPAWKKALEGWNVIQSQQVLEWQAQARAESLVEVLQERFKTVPESLLEQVRELRDMTVLQRWLKAAARAETLEEFLQQSQAQGGT
jgi:hypothetical protein